MRSLFRANFLGPKEKEISRDLIFDLKKNSQKEIYFPKEKEISRKKKEFQKEILVTTELLSKPSQNRKCRSHFVGFFRTKSQEKKFDLLITRGSFHELMRDKMGTNPTQTVVLVPT